MVATLVSRHFALLAFPTFLLAPAFLRTISDAYYLNRVKPLQERNLAIDYEIEKSEFVVGEPIFVQYWVIDNSAEIQYFMSPDVARFDVLTEDGKKLPHTLGMLDVTYFHPPFVPGVGDGVHKAIQPGSRSQLQSTEVLTVYGRGIVGAGAYLPPGKYRVLSRNLISDTVQFEIVTPPDTLEAAACRLLVSLVEDRDRRVKLSEIEATYLRILELSPRSALAPVSLARLAGLRGGGGRYAQPELLQGYLQKLIAEFPTHRYALKYLSSLDPAMVSEVQRPVIVRSLRQMLSTQIDTLYQNRINEMLRRLE